MLVVVLFVVMHGLIDHALYLCSVERYSFRYGFLCLFVEVSAKRRLDILTGEYLQSADALNGLQDPVFDLNHLRPVLPVGHKPLRPKSDVLRLFVNMCHSPYLPWRISPMSIDWSSIPAPASYADLYAHYGDPADPHFERDYIVSNPHMVGGREVHIQAHVALTERLHQVFADLTRSGAISHLHTFDGSFVVRSIRGSVKKSLHSWALAFDFNAAENPLGGTPTMHPEVVAAFKRAGFVWGGEFRGRRDGMHFQFSAPHTI